MNPFRYELPDDRIAQRPVYPYDSAKMLVVDRSGSTLRDSTFLAFPELLRREDLVIFNDSKVIPARLFGKLAGKEAEIELLLLTPLSSDGAEWECLGRPLKKLPPGSVVEFAHGLTCTIGERISEMSVHACFSAAKDSSKIKELLSIVGSMPIPPYIRGGRGDEQDRIDYQPTLASEDGSVAAPTASLHFTPPVMSAIAAVGAKAITVTLHVGSASFLPLWRPGQSDQLTKPGSERMRYSRKVVEQITATRANGGRVFAVGTTVVRALESMALMPPETADGAPVSTELFITPGHTFKNLDVIVTNFHQPATTHLLLVQAFMGAELLQRSYEHALNNNYRFLSYGDGMCIL